MPPTRMKSILEALSRWRSCLKSVTDAALGCAGRRGAALRRASGGPSGSGCARRRSAGGSGAAGSDRRPACRARRRGRMVEAGRGRASLSGPWTSETLSPPAGLPAAGAELGEELVYGLDAGGWEVVGVLPELGQVAASPALVDRYLQHELQLVAGLHQA